MKMKRKSNLFFLLLWLGLFLLLWLFLNTNFKFQISIHISQHCHHTFTFQISQVTTNIHISQQAQHCHHTFNFTTNIHISQQALNFMSHESIQFLCQWNSKSSDCKSARLQPWRAETPIQKAMCLTPSSAQRHQCSIVHVLFYFCLLTLLPFCSNFIPKTQTLTRVWLQHKLEMNQRGFCNFYLQFDEWWRLKTEEDRDPETREEASGEMRGTRKVSGWSGAPEGDAQAGGGRSQWQTQSKRLRRRDLEAIAEEAGARGARCLWVLSLFNYGPSIILSSNF